MEARGGREREDGKMVKVNLPLFHGLLYLLLPRISGSEIRESEERVYSCVCVCVCVCVCDLT